MAVINVPDMHCENCVRRITEALGKAGVEFSVSLEAKTVTVNGCDGCVAKAMNALDDLGFSAERK